METIETADLEAFVAVARAGSFTRAADLRATRKAHLSRVVSRLEARLGVRLLQRTTRSLALTEVGRELFERAQAILTAMDAAVLAAAKTRQAPSGVLRLTCGTEFGQLVVNRWVARYLQRWPHTRVEAEFTNRVVDLVHEGFDLAVRVGTLEDSGLASRKLGEVTYGLFASPSYLTARGQPRSIAELARHDLVLSTQTRQRGNVWEFVAGARRCSVTLTPRYLVNTHLAVRDAAAEGVGLALLPRFQAAPLVADGRLQAVLPTWGRVGAPVHAVFPSGRFLAPAVRAFVDLALASFEGDVAAGYRRGFEPGARRGAPTRSARASRVVSASSSVSPRASSRR